MAKFPIERFPAGFFDLSQDLVKTLPVEVIDRWTHSDHSLNTALEILNPYIVSGTVMSTDSAGLTRLSRRRGLVEILALINHPKELVHAYGKCLGAESIGIWAADNTEMLFPKGTSAERILSMALAMMDQIRRECEVPIGVGLHRGEFFHLGGGLYGTEADRVEHLCETHAEGDEILATAELTASLGKRHTFELTRQLDLPVSAGEVYRVENGPRLTGLQPTEYHYPFPYSEEFYRDLRAFTPGHEEGMQVRYTQKRTVVLIEREREETDVPEIAVLNDLALSAAMARLGAQLIRDHGGVEIKTAGSIGIFTLPDARSSLAFARLFQQAFLAQGISSRIGISQGDVLVFDLGSGRSDIAGMPVNIASKMAQDHGEFGKIYVSEEAASQLDAAQGFEQRRMEISGVEIAAWVG